ncbi:MAG TPA: DUF4097 family beta strand repeat-containing protein [Thermoanaerobaculia bacterium]|nr:DUF4097 family beta strand repeat-containing protein [Thermoanaerobaculia bacterium]
MRSPLRHLAPAAAVAALVLAAAAPAAAETIEKTLEQTYRLGRGGHVEVENVNGAVVVETWDRSEVRVRATKKVRATSDESAAEAMERMRIVVEEGAGRLRLVTRYGEAGDGFFGWLRGHSERGSISYHLTVPRGIRLVAETVNGSVTLRSVDGDVAAETVNGSIKVEDARGRLDASTVNGSIKVAMREVAPDADLDFSTTNGSVTVALPADVRTDLRLRTTNGGIDVDLPMEVHDRSRRRLDATLNGGGGSVRVETTNGAIRVVES